MKFNFIKKIYIIVSIFTFLLGFFVVINKDREYKSFSYDPSRIVNEVRFSRKSVEVKKGESTNVYLYVSPPGTTGKILWIGGDSNVTIKFSGNVFTITPKENAVVGASGSIFAYSAEHNTLSDSCYYYITGDSENEVNINSNVSVKEITVESDNIDIEIGQEKEVKWTINPSNAINKNVTVTSSDENVVSVTKGDSLFTITAKEIGKANITITSLGNRNIKKTISVNVTAKEEKEENNVKEESELPQNNNVNSDSNQVNKKELIIIGIIVIIIIIIMYILFGKKQNYQNYQ